MEMSARAAAAPNDAEKVRIREEMRSYAMANGGAGAERFFAGKTSEDAIVKLADKEGKPRLLIKVDANGDPSIEFRADSGQVVQRIKQYTRRPARHPDRNTERSVGKALDSTYNYLDDTA